MIQLTINPQHEDTNLFVVLCYFPNEPVEVYGVFTSEEEARKYAEDNRIAVTGAYQVQHILNAHYHEDESDYAGMGWIGRDGQP